MSEHGPTAQGARAAIDPWVFFIAAGISLAFVLWGVIDADGVGAVADDVLTWIISTFGWVFVIGTAGFLVFAFVLAFSRFGSVRLGRDDDRPEFRTVSWIAMMFSAGMGIGLMFYAVAEPISHMTAPPAGTEEAGTAAAAQQAMSISYFHWALHPWAIYAIVGLALAYFTFRKGMPNLISSAFYPLLGDRVKGPIGRSIDILAIFATLFGSATSLGLGALQINSGLDFLWGVEPSDAIAVTIIAVLTAGVRPVGGLGRPPRHPVAQQRQHGPRDPARALPAHRRADGVPVRDARRVDRRLRDDHRARQLPHRRVRRLRVAVVAGRSSTGRGGSRGRPSWAPSSPASRRAGRARVRHRRAADPERRELRLVRRLRRRGDRPPARRPRTSAGSSARPRSRCSRCSRSSRSPAHLVRRDRAGGAVLRQRRGRRVAGDGHAVLAREPHAVAPRGHRAGASRPARRPRAAAGRRPQLAPAGRDHRRRAVHDRDGRALHIGVQGARRGGGAADHPRAPPPSPPSACRY